MNRRATHVALPPSAGASIGAGACAALLAAGLTIAFPCPLHAQTKAPAAPAAAAPAQEAAPTDAPPAAEADAPVPPELTKPDPPPSTWDRKLQEHGDDPQEEDEGRTLMEQLLRTVFSLIIVVALIYLFARFGLQRFAGLKRTGSGGKVVDVVERTQLDAKHALYVVDYGKERLLLGSGERGLEVLSREDAPADKEPKSSFRSTMAALAGGATSPSTSSSAAKPTDTPTEAPKKEDTDA